MKESTIKKEFRKNDVQRMRNLITGKSGERTQVLAGWDKESQFHKEGDVWEEGGRTWTIKNGIKQTVTKFDNLKKLAILPLCCPKCKKHMELSDLNKKMYSIHGICFNCTIDMEHEIKKSGGWDEYVKGQQNASKKDIISDIEKALDDWYAEKETYVTEDGDIQGWSGGSRKEIYDYVKDQINKAKEEDIY
jgi:hypothetical protein